jgi:hypothetical protein
MTQLQLIALILSAPFAVALTSIIRRLSQRPDGTPRIDGPALVWGVAISLSVLGNVLLVVTTQPITAAAISWAVGIGLGTGIMGCGIKDAADGTASKGSTQRTIAVTTREDPRATIPIEPSLARLAALTRDTEPEDTAPKEQS